MVGVEWHPEDTAAEDSGQRALFEGFVLMARIHGSTAIPGVRDGRSRDYAIEDHDPAWSGLFEDEAARIREALGALAVRVDHVGSTAVFGLAAKPVVDIQISVASLVPRAPLIEPLESLGYTFQADPTTAEHEYLKKDADGTRRFQLHLCEAGGEWERRHLAFRDWLRDHTGDAAAYADLKRRLAAEHPRDLYTYTEAKSAFIDGIVERALASIA
jgi:GrpB-like predicted nucleotidyltransferase (UPF0157 family)